MWTQLRPAGHETGVLPGVLPRLRVALVFPTQALGQEGLALRCNSNKSPNHLIASGAKDEGTHHFLLPGACPPRGAPRCPAGRGSEHSRLSWPPPIEGACVPPASSRERWGHGSRQEHGPWLQTAAACPCKWLALDKSDSYGLPQQDHPSAVAIRAESSRARYDGSYRSWSRPGLSSTRSEMAVACRWIVARRATSSLTGCPSLHCYPRYAVECR